MNADQHYQEAFRHFEKHPDDVQFRRKLFALSERLPQHRMEIFDALELNVKVYDSFKKIGLKLNEISQSGRHPRMFYELMSGAIIWTDELIYNNPQYQHLERLESDEVSSMRYIFHYRTQFTLSDPPIKYEPYWLEAKRCFPNWIGFKESRSTLTQNFRDCYEAHHPSHPKIVDAHCPQCQTQLRSNKARQCLSCGVAWHTGTVRDEVYDWSTVTISEIDTRLSVNRRNKTDDPVREGFRTIWHLLKWDSMEESKHQLSNANNSQSSSLLNQIGRSILVLFLSYLAIGALYSAWETARQLFNF